MCARARAHTPYRRARTVQPAADSAPRPLGGGWWLGAHSVHLLSPRPASTPGCGEPWRSGRTPGSLPPWRRPTAPSSWGKAAWGRAGAERSLLGPGRRRRQRSESPVNLERCRHCSSYSPGLGRMWVQNTALITTLETSLLFALPSVFPVNRVTDTVAILEDKPYLL